MTRPPPIFSASYAPDAARVCRELLPAAPASSAADQHTEALARDLIGAIRAAPEGLGGIDTLLREYALSTKEGLALMVLAEALLRVPDAATADRLIEDKLGQGGFATHEVRSHTPLVGASAWALGLSSRIIALGETPDGIIAALVRRIGVPTVRLAARRAMRIMGDHFVLGETIEEALQRAASDRGRLFRYSFDMLGEGARTAADADAYRASYSRAIDAIGRTAGNRPLPDRPGISVKLSALHPRYEALSRARVLRELTPIVLDLAEQAKGFDLAFTVDAEEADRLELSLEVFAAVLANPSLAGWDGFGLAIQAYQKRCLSVIDHVAALAAHFDRRLMVRLVKGAYWDTEIKRAQERGLDDYPVYTRKSLTDFAFEAAATRLLAHRPRLFPQFATHNALSAAAIVSRVGGNAEGFEFQRLHGMGDALYAKLLTTNPGLACRTYAPVGRHRELLAYLVRRLLENGANSSFVSQAIDPAVPIEALLLRPAERLDLEDTQPILAPRDLFSPDRLNSRGCEFGEQAALAALLEEIRAASGLVEARCVINGVSVDGARASRLSPIDAKTVIGDVVEAKPELADGAMVAAAVGARAWANVSVADRANALDKVADGIEAAQGRLLHLLQVEAGKTLDDALAELREAVDFCRYYAAEGHRLFGIATGLPGPVGESNRLTWRSRGVFVAISPWNFPLAIFVGQIAAALVAGNAVVAKPAEQTPLIAAEAVRLMHQAGVMESALQLVLGNGDIGARLVAHPRVAGVVFTGSTSVAHAINRTLAAKDGPIVPLIAETGGINAMIVDATALPEQVTDDVVTSAFRSAGQRCSALRLLLLQDNIADGMIAMIAGSAAELCLGDPRDPATHIGPVIDAGAQDRLDAYVAAMPATAKQHLSSPVPKDGFYVAPKLFEIAAIADLGEEVFGPILHVARYEPHDLDAVCDAIAAKGYGLTLAIHSRIDATVTRIVARLPIGNVYVNRNMIGAVVGSQPFGGSGLSGTGPKAGGPNYLPRFAIEQTVTINTAAIGGDAALMTVRHDEV